MFKVSGLQGSLIVSLVVVALASGFFWSAKNWGTQASKGDDVVYKGIALDVLNHGSYTYESEPTNVEPLYPFFLVALFAVFGVNDDIVRIAQIVIFALTIVLFYYLSVRLIGKKFGSMVSFAVALWYGLASPAAFLNRENLLIFLSVSLLVVLYRLHDTQERRWYMVAGVVLGLLTLTNSSFEFLWLVVLAGLVVLYYSQLSLHRLLGLAAVMLVGFALILSPWLIHNYRRHSGDLITSRKGMLLLRKTLTAEVLSQNPWLNLLGYGFGYYFAEHFDRQITERAFPKTNVTEELQLALVRQGYSYAQVDQLFTQKAIARIKTVPWHYAYGVLINVVHLNNAFIPDKDDFGSVPIILLFAQGRHPGLSPFIKAGVLLAIESTWLLFWAFIIYAVIAYRRDWRKLFWLYLVIIYSNGVYGLIHAIPRFALPIYPFYVILTTSGFILLYRRYLLKFRILQSWTKLRHKLLRSLA